MEFLKVWGLVVGLFLGAAAVACGVYGLGVIANKLGGGVGLGVYCFLLFTAVIAAIVTGDAGSGW